MIFFLFLFIFSSSFSISLVPSKLFLILMSLISGFGLIFSLKNKFSIYTIHFKYDSLYIFLLFALNCFGTIGAGYFCLVKQAFSFWLIALIALSNILFIITVIYIQLFYSIGSSCRYYKYILNNIVYINILLFLFVIHDVYKGYLNLIHINESFLFFLPQFTSFMYPLCLLLVVIIC